MSKRRACAGFAAIDFETAPDGRATALAVVCVRQRRLESSIVRTLDPSDASSFRDAWRECADLLRGARFLAAHNARFDRAILHASCAAAGLPRPRISFRCTVALARRTWALRRADLATVCRYLAIPLQHHDPLSDAQACAQIVLAATSSEKGTRGAR